MSELNYPEMGKLRDIIQEYDGVVAFLKWLTVDMGVSFCSFNHALDRYEPLLGAEDPEYLAARHFGIDLTKLEEERHSLVRAFIKENKE